jgi:hypothetical protein
LEAWKNRQHRERYHQVRAEVAGKVGDQIAAMHEDLALKAALKAEDAIDALHVSELPARELPGAVRNLATAAGIATDKSSALRGRPTEVHEHRHVDEILNRLRQRFPGLVIDGTVDEEPADRNGRKLPPG